MFFFLTVFLLFLSFIFVEKISRGIKLLDYPNERKLHNKEIPNSGGLLIYIFFISFFISLENNQYLWFKPILFISSVFFFIGLIDDYKNIGGNKKFILSIFILFLFFILNENFKLTILNINYIGKIELQYTSTILTLLCVLLMQNAINLIDGINGLSTLIILSFFSWIIYNNNFFFNHTFIQLLFLLLVFLIFNLRNKVFLGNSGTFFFSTLISFLLIFNNENFNNNLKADEIFLFFMIPGIDMMRLFFTRIKNKKSPFKADKNHIHHLLIKKYKSQTISLVIIISLCVHPIIILEIFNVNSFFLIIINTIIYFFIINKLNKI